MGIFQSGSFATDGNYNQYIDGRLRLNKGTVRKPEIGIILEKENLIFERWIIIILK